MFTIKEYKGSDGTNLRYGMLTDSQRTEPSSQAMLFVPGLGGSVKDALTFLEHLLPEFDPIYAPDLRGFGLNEEHPLPHPDVYLDDLAAFESAVQITQHPSVTLCGISLGGVIATKLAVKQPDLFDGVVLVAPAYQASRTSFPLSYVIKNTLGRLFGGKNHQTRLPYSTEALTRNPDILNDPAYRDKEPLQLASGYLLQLSLFNFVGFQRTRQISIPSLVIVPGKDIVCDPVYMVKGFNRIPESANKTLKEYPELFHDVLMEPEVPQIARDVIEWHQTLKGRQVNHGETTPAL